MAQSAVDFDFSIGGIETGDLRAEIPRGAEKPATSWGGCSPTDRSLPNRRPVLGVSIFADRGYLRAEMAEDAEAAGLRIARACELGALLGDGVVGPGVVGLGDIVLVDCPVIDGAELAALAELDIQVARAGGELVVSTSMDSLEAVFGCMDQCGPQILVNPTRGERVIALGRVLARAGGTARVRELSEEDRMALLRLTEQVGQIAQRLDRLSSGLGSSDPSATATSAGASAFPFDDAERDEANERLLRTSRPPLPDPRLVRRIIRQRQLRSRFFDGELFADPAWDMLLDLTAARAEHSRVSVTSLCIASGVPPTTALRWIGQMTDSGLLQRVDDEVDRRRAFITLTDKAADAMARYFAELGTASASLT